MKPFFILIGIAFMAFLSFFAFPFWKAMLITSIAFVVLGVILMISATREFVAEYKEIQEINKQIRELKKKINEANKRGI